MLGSSARHRHDGLGGSTGTLELPADIAEWLDAYRKKHGRPPRILHIGNIANNAYNNAKLFIQAGFDCDVLCHDYYHIMGCPEWEDADFDGGFGDHFHPQWADVEMPGYARPGWFAQGPLKLCIGYLIAKRTGNRRLASESWQTLSQLNGTRRPPWAEPGSVRLFTRYVVARLSQNKALADEALRGLAEIDSTWKTYYDVAKLRWLGLRMTLSHYGRRALGVERFGEVVDQTTRRLVAFARDTVRRAARAGRAWFRHEARWWRRFGRKGRDVAKAGGVWFRDEARWWTGTGIPSRLRIYLARQRDFPPWRILGRPLSFRGPVVTVKSGTRFRWRALRYRIPLNLPLGIRRLNMPPGNRASRRLAGCIAATLGAVITTAGAVIKFCHRQIISLASIAIKRFRYVRRVTLGDLNIEATANDFRNVFPDRADKLEPEDILPYTAYLDEWKYLFNHYDIIIGYSTDPILPYLAGVPYFAFEHGTLREIPFRTSAQGRLTALAYHHAEHVFVTNFDCLGNAEVLCGERHSFINHPYDEDHGLAVQGVDELRRELCKVLQADFLVFFPTRHDWIAGTGYADKANEEFLGAFCRLRARGHRIGMVCCAWGKNVEESKRLLSDKGCLDYVKWCEPMGVVRFDRMSRACDLVADQFKLGAFGGVTFKALAVGVPVCSYLDPALLAGLYPRLPPVINCRTEEEIVTELADLIGSRDKLQALGQASRSWIKQYHSGRDVVAAQAREFMTFLEHGKEREEQLCVAS